jgi:hypothetical protein
MRIGIPDGGCERAFSFQNYDDALTYDDSDPFGLLPESQKSKSPAG